MRVTSIGSGPLPPGRANLVRLDGMLFRVVAEGSIECISAMIRSGVVDFHIANFGDRDPLCRMKSGEVVSFAEFARRVDGAK